MEGSLSLEAFFLFVAVNFPSGWVTALEVGALVPSSLYDAVAGALGTSRFAVATVTVWLGAIAAG